MMNRKRIQIDVHTVPVRSRVCFFNGLKMDVKEITLRPFFFVKKHKEGGYTNGTRLQ